jgi:cytochrome c oxidase assembly protein subunit 15
MSSQAAFDLAPLAHVMLMGLVLALGPLAWVWLRGAQQEQSRRLQMLTLLTLFLSFDLVLFGAFTRLSDSGLGCPDWPGCYGQASPIGAGQHIAAAQQAMPTGPVTLTKAWIEMLHRYLGSAVGVLILTLALASWVARKRSHISPWWPGFTLAWVCLQGGFGALTVSMKLFPAIVTLHLLGGMVLLALLRVQALRYAQAQGRSALVVVSARTRQALAIALALVWTQIALGGWVSTNYAVLACNDFPQCQGSWWPAMDFAQGFETWRGLGLRSDGANISLQALTAIHFSHRLLAFAVFAALLWLASRLHSEPALRRQARWIAGLVAWQFASGLANVVFDWPLLAALAHTGGAAALVLVLTGLQFSTRNASDAVSAGRLRSSELSA